MHAKIVYDRDYAVGGIDRRMAGSFVEHLNRCVYGGLFEPGHPEADEAGFRKDVLRAVLDAGVRLVRYPGGNFVSGYCWKDGVGPRDKRPRRKDLAWGVIETNQVGTGEMASCLKALGIELMMSVNLGTGTPLEAAELVEYCNTPSGTYWSDLRRANGSPDPYGVKLWCLGNEMDGPWQLGNLPAADYARKCAETALLMRRADPSIELVAGGSCTNEPGHASFAHWDRTVLEAVYDQIDYLSLHRYYGYDVDRELFYPRRDTRRDIAYMATDLEEMLSEIAGTIDHVKGAKHSAHKVFLSLDELSLLPREARLPDGTPVHEFTQLDAVLYGGLLCTLLNHADRVKINCQSLLVNENGMFTTVPMGGLIPQPILHPFRDVARYARGRALRSAGQLPTVETEHYGPQPCVRTACACDEEAGELNVFVANCALDEDIALSLSLRGFGPLEPVEHIELAAADPDAHNTEQLPGAVRPRALPLARPENGELGLQVRRHSWNVYRFRLTGGGDHIK